MKLKIILIAFLLSSLLGLGQSIFNNPITGTNPDTANPYTAGQVVTANITVSGIGRGTGIVGSNANNRYNASGWNSPSLDVNDYFEFTLTPNAGFKIDFVSFVYTGQASGTGPVNFAFRSSADGFTSNIGTPNAAGTTISLAAAAYQNITGTITFRFYGWGASAAGGTFSINDFTFNGTVSSTCGPTTQASGITTSGETLSGFNVNWTAGNGTGGTMIVVKPSPVVTPPPQTLPVNGTVYTPNLDWASAGQIDTNNRVVFRGLGTSAGPITGLASGSQYSVYAYEYNAGTNCYNLATSMGTGYTRAVEPSGHAAAFSCTTASSSQINLSFSAASTITNATGYILLQSTTGTPTGVPTDGNSYAAGTVLGDATVVAYIGPAATAYSVTGLSPATTYYYTLIPYNSFLSVPVTLNYNLNPTIPSSSCTTGLLVSNASDIVAVAASESATISSTITNNAPLTSATGVQVWQFTVRDGGVGLNDTDAFPTILTDFTLAQGAGNAVGTWSDAINTVELFDGATRIAAATVTANQIQFTGLNVVVADNTAKTLSLRLSLKCPLGADAFDGEDFVFSLSNANTTFSPAGSGKAAFTAAVSTNGQNMIAVVATRLTFTTQPTTTGVNAVMSNVVVAATDACGNKDNDFSGTVTVTSTGTMTGTPLTTATTTGAATFSGIVHTVVGSGFILNASTPGLTSATSSLFNITTVTTLQRGDLAILAVNTNISGGTDEVAFVCFQDILPGTTFYITDNGYERQFAGEWGGTEGVVTLTRTGSTLTRGTVIVFRSTTGNVTNATHFDIYTCGVIDTNWNKSALSGGSIGGFNLNSDDDMWIMQGGTWTNDVTHHSTYTGGTVLYGWTESGWNTAPGGAGGDTRWSTVIPGLECYNTVAPTGPGFVKFNDPVNPDFSTLTNGRLDWIALINNTANWDTYADDATYSAGGYNYLGNTSCPQMTIAPSGYINGKWTGRVDTNWFNCGNWDTLVVPDATVDVQVGDNVFNRQAIVDATAPFASYYGNIAQTKNLTITGEKVEVTIAPANVLQVHGNLLIDAPAGALDMGDSNAGTADGQLYLYGNWTNTMGNAAFEEGNGTVHFTGTTPQIINNVTPVGTEVFYNVVLNNNFNTAVSNDLIASNNLTVNATRTLSVDSAGYAQVNNALTNNGTVVVEDNGQFIQINETDTNAGTYTGTAFQVKRNADNIRSLDYVFWGATVENYDIANINGTLRYYWDTTFINPNGTEGYWLNASGNMVKGRGYIVRAPSSFSTPQTLPVTFSGKPYNGQFNYAATRGTNVGSKDDNLVLVGNPYASALDADVFISENSTNIEGAVRIWTHGTLPNSAITSPFYQNFAANYTVNDYIVYNGTATTIPGVFDGKIASGQGFFVTLLESGAAAKNIVFKNSMRGNAITPNVLDNTQFFKSAATGMSGEKHRIWLDIVGPINNVGKAVVGYVSGATMEKDNYYDAYAKLGSELSLYSLIGAEAMHIQGRALPFADSDIVPLGIEVPVAGNHTIAIGYLDGLFAGNQNIYLEDRALAIIHDLKANPYHFTVANTGQLNERFVLRFTTEALGTSDPAAVANSVKIYGNQGIHISSGLQNIQSVWVYDLLGRELAVKKNIGQQSVTLSEIAVSNSAYLVKVVLEDGTKVDRKIIY